MGFAPKGWGDECTRAVLISTESFFPTRRGRHVQGEKADLTGLKIQLNAIVAATIHAENTQWIIPGSDGVGSHEGNFS